MLHSGKLQQKIFSFGEALSISSLVVILVHYFLNRDRIIVGPWFVYTMIFLSLIVFTFVTHRIKESVLVRRMIAISQVSFPLLFVVSFVIQLNTLPNLTIPVNVKYITLLLTGITASFTVIQQWKSGLLQEAEENSWPRLSKSLAIGLASSVLIVGLYLRIKNSSMISFWFDESITVLVAKRIYAGFGDTFLSGEHYKRALVYHYLLGGVVGAFQNLELATRAFNILFYIPNCILIYLWTKRINNHALSALMSVALFSICSFSIGMFREARFYEFLVLLILVICYNFYLIIDKYCSLDAINIKNVLSQFKHKKFTASALSTLAAGLIIMNTSEISVYIFYPIICFGIYLYATFNKKFGIFIACITLLTLAAAMRLKFGSDFSLFFLLKQPQLAWKAILPDRSILEFLKYILRFEFTYIIVGAAITIPVLFIKRKNKLFVYTSMLLIALYLIISYQGYGTITVRYYYIAIPFLSIISGSVLGTYLGIFEKKKFQFSVMAIGLTLILANCFYYGVKESQSATTNSSMIEAKNTDFKNEFDFINDKIARKSSIMISDKSTSIAYYLRFNQAPDYLIAEDNKLEEVINGRDLYLNTQIISYKNLNQLDKDKFVYLVMWYSPSFRHEELMQFLDSQATLVYQLGPKRVYYINRSI